MAKVCCCEGNEKKKECVPIGGGVHDRMKGSSRFTIDVAKGDALWEMSWQKKTSKRHYLNSSFS
jgi:hypothetical protein